MVQTIVVPKTFIRKMEKASQAFQALEDQLEDILISQNDALLKKLTKAREEHLQGNLKPFEDIQRTLR